MIKNDRQYNVNMNMNRDTYVEYISLYTILFANYPMIQQQQLFIIESITNKQANKQIYECICGRPHIATPASQKRRAHNTI